MPYKKYVGLCGTTLFSAIAGELPSDLKAGCQLANRIEEDLIHRRWPVDTMYGAEAELCERFQVGRAAVREAVRVLEVHGYARMRRGPNGGLLVLRPGRTQCAEMAANYVQLLGMSAEQIDEAESMLGRVESQLVDAARVYGSRWSAGELVEISNITMPFFKELIAVIKLFGREYANTLAGSKNQPLFHRSRAGQIARRLMSEYAPAEWARGTRLGSILNLCERYDVYRDVMRQAIRILESTDMAVSLTGRGHGLVSQTPRPASVCRLISCHFAAHGLSYAAAMKFHHCISVEAMAKIAAVATPADVVGLNRALDKIVDVLENTREEQLAELADSIHEAEERQFTVLGNPLIDLFLRSVRAFSGWQIASVDESLLRNQIRFVGRHSRSSVEKRSEWNGHSGHFHSWLRIHVATYLAETRKVAAAIASGDPALAVQAQDVKNQRLAGISQALLTTEMPDRLAS